MRISDFSLFLLDMDGTLYLGEDLFPETPAFLKAIREHGGRYVYLTNNSSKDKQSYVEKLRRLGLEADASEVFSSGDATAVLLKRRGISRICLIGTAALERLFREAGFILTEENPEVLVLGFDTELTYRKLTVAHQWLCRGLPWICTHPDFVCPMEGGKTIPDIGSMIALLRASSGREPDEIIGKPSKSICDAALELYGGDPSTTCMVGDRLYTDIALGKNSGIGSVLVFSGETSREEYENQTAYHADFAFPTVGEIAQALAEGK